MNFSELDALGAPMKGELRADALCGNSELAFGDDRGTEGADGLITLSPAYICRFFRLEDCMVHGSEK